MRFYEAFLRPLLFLLDPEAAHHFAIGLLQELSRAPFLLSLLARPAGRNLEREVFGLRFPNPIGLAAGFDKNGVALPAWASLGFGFVEIGTVTALPQPGNPKPRIFRLPELEALINRLGFNNEGAERIGCRLEALRDRNSRPGIPVGINIGKSRITPLEQASDDYVRSFRRLRDLGDYFVLNVSSPNTPGLRQLQERDALENLFKAIQDEGHSKPLLVKIAPDLTAEQIDDVIELAEAHQLAGLIAANTTIDHSRVPANRREQGGLSGRPLRERALEILQYIRKRTRLPVIAVGGIMSADDAKARFDAGADLIQIFTGFVYRGPALVGEIARAIG
ncbi:MAG: quinone-dependent dihydroorotate dehydrogenase [Chthoniobacterales bacterium]